ncbi:hypothetical protein AB9F29_20275 [Falsihalocynthiibacter sp. S25ZX9]|uniref:hypothetical protein n=1 Tax=Falsihalocynthiibacter sp. S25ZX9 TaxID=3240870 RepID=UPI0035102AD2
MNGNSPISVGLAGDGDEVDAIENVERVFAIKLNYNDASSWETAGDVFMSLQKVLPASELSSQTLWERFAEALALETGVDAKKIDRNSPLLLPTSFSWKIALVRVSIAAFLIFGLLFLVSL